MNFEILKGKIIVKIENQDNEQLTLTSKDGKCYMLYHEQDCCESVLIEDINGELDDLLNSPILVAEESTSHENPPNVNIDYQDSFTWTFYRLATMKGWVIIRWYGESNGYYSESVDFVEC